MIAPPLFRRLDCQAEIEEQKGESSEPNNCCFDEILDRLLVMKQQETMYKHSHNCPNKAERIAIDSKQKKSRITTSQENAYFDIHKCWRSTMCSWFYNVVDNCELSRETAFIAMSYVDRYVRIMNLYNREENKNKIERKEYQLICMTALYMAIKIHEKCVIKIKDILKLCQGYDDDDIRNMELSILKTLQWKMHGPTPYDFLWCYISILFASSSKSRVPGGMLSSILIKSIVSNARNQIEQSFCSNNQQVLPSHLAFAAIMNVITQIDDKFLSSYCLERFLITIDYCIPGLTTTGNKTQ